MHHHSKILCYQTLGWCSRK